MKITDLPTNIIDKCLDNDDDAWRQLFQATYPLAKWVAMSNPFCFDVHIAEDIAQETIMVLCKKIDKVHSIKSFVARISHNKCIDYLRKKNPAKPIYEENILEYIDNIDGIAYDSIVLETLKSHIDKMKSPCCDLIRNRFFLEMSYKDISAINKLPVSQVGVYLSRCLANLKKELIAKQPDFISELKLLLRS